MSDLTTADDHRSGFHILADSIRDAVRCQHSSQRAQFALDLLLRATDDPDAALVAPYYAAGIRQALTRR